jgi:hypothetical protein
MKPICSLLAASSLAWIVGCASYFPEDEWDDFVMTACVHKHDDQTAYNRCYRDGTRSRRVCYDAESTTICRDRPYGNCEPARLGAQYSPSPHSSSCG